MRAVAEAQRDASARPAEARDNSGWISITKLTLRRAAQQGMDTADVIGSVYLDILVLPCNRLDKPMLNSAWDIGWSRPDIAWFCHESELRRSSAEVVVYDI